MLVALESSQLSATGPMVNLGKFDTVPHGYGARYNIESGYLSGRDDWTRTSDLSSPRRTRYQTALHPGPSSCLKGS